jgi:hypothetical protein
MEPAKASVAAHGAKTARIFVSYKRDMEPDEPVAKQIVEALGQNYSVFIDQIMLVGNPWTEQIKAEIQQSDALIVLLSEHSVHSELDSVAGVPTATKLEAKALATRPGVFSFRGFCQGKG